METQQLVGVGKGAIFLKYDYNFQYLSQYFKGPRVLAHPQLAHPPGWIAKVINSNTFQAVNSKHLKISVTTFGLSDDK